MILMSRRLADSLDTIADLEKIFRRVSNLDTSSLTFYGENLSSYLKDCHAFFCQASRMISEVASAIQTFHLPKSPDPALAQTSSELERWQRASDDAWNRLRQIADSVQSSQFPVLQKGMSQANPT